MQSHPPPEPPEADWAKFLVATVESDGERFDLTKLRPGDFLRVFTAHTVYTFQLLEARDAILTTNRSDRARGRVRIVGCTFGQSSSILPDHISCGGNLEFLHDDGTMTCTTTAIRGIQHVQRRPAT